MSMNQELSTNGLNEERVVLISVVGMSPAVVTESIWGLHQEHPELVPDEVVVYTTRVAWDNLHKALTSTHEGTSVWEDLQQKVGKNTYDIGINTVIRTESCVGASDQVEGREEKNQDLL